MKNRTGPLAKVERIAEGKPAGGGAKASPADSPAPPRKPPIRPAAPPPAYEPFPVDALPDPLRSLAAEGAAAYYVDPSFFALPGLAAAAGLVGTSRSVKLKANWREPWRAVGRRRRRVVERQDGPVQGRHGTPLQAERRTPGRVPAAVRRLRGGVASLEEGRPRRPGAAARRAEVPVPRHQRLHRRAGGRNPGGQPERSPARPRRAVRLDRLVRPLPAERERRAELAGVLQRRPDRHPPQDGRPPRGRRPECAPERLRHDPAQHHEPGRDRRTHRVGVRRAAAVRDAADPPEGVDRGRHPPRHGRPVGARRRPALAAPPARPAAPAGGRRQGPLAGLLPGHRQGPARIGRPHQGRTRQAGGRRRPGSPWSTTWSSRRRGSTTRPTARSRPPAWRPGSPWRSGSPARPTASTA